MNCDRAQAVLSDRLDGERAPERVGLAVDEHAASCPRCRSFEAGAVRLRASVRVRAAEPVPDLVGSIMARVASEASVRPRERVLVPAAGRRRPGRSRRLTPVIAAAVAGLMAGSVVVGGPWQRPTTRPIAAAAVVLGVQATAPSLDAFAATFAVTEHGLSPDVPERRLRMDVAFLAPQRFRLDVTDQTTYPSTRWTPTDLTFVADGTSTYRSGATGCPANLPDGGCPPTRTTVTTRSAYSLRAPAPADLVLPLTTFSSADGIEVVGTDRVAERDAIRVRLTFARARALFPFLQLGGTWRPFFDDDRVDLWLDAAGWFPLRYTVVPSTDPSRAPWELRFGLPHEPTDRPIFDVRLTSIEREAPDASTFDVPGWSRAPSVPLASFPRRVGYLPVTPAEPGALRLSGAVVPPGDEDDVPRSVLLYTDGMSYVRIGERPDWTGRSLFGPDRRGRTTGGPGRWRASRTTSPPATGSDAAWRSTPRRPTSSSSPTSPVPNSSPWPRRSPSAAGRSPTRGGRSRARASRSNGSRPTRPWRARRSPSTCRRPCRRATCWRARWSRRTPTTAERAVVAVTFVFRQRESDDAGGPIVLHIQVGEALPPASSARQSLLDLDGAEARWTPERSLLEWIDGGAYLSLEGDLTLTAMLDLASQVRPSEAGP